MTGRHADDDQDGVVNQADPDWVDDTPASTAGEQDHSDPWVFAGDDADAPASDGDDLDAWGGA